MKKERSILELLQLLLSVFDDKMSDGIKTFGVTGMCDVVGELLYVDKQITDIERDILIVFINANKPKNIDTTIYGYWFEPYLKEPRKKWLTQQIKNLSK